MEKSSVDEKKYSEVSKMKITGTIAFSYVAKKFEWTWKMKC